jgi:diguanylate cyclase (GGDEF)-like protein
MGILNSLDSYIVVVKENGSIFFTNNSWEKLTEQLGITKNIVWLSKNYYQYCHLLQTESNGFASQCKQAVAGLIDGSSTEFTLEFKAPSVVGEVWLEVTGSVVVFDKERYVILNHANIIDRKMYQAEIEKLTLTDTLTHLANQKNFNGFFFNEWQRSMRNGSAMALLIGELDTNMHELDSNQYRNVANIFKCHARRVDDLAAILDNHQFALILGQVGTLSYESVAKSLYQEISQLNLLSDTGQEIHINIGMSSAIPTLIDTSDILFNSVVLALNKAKTSQQEHIFSHYPTIIFKQKALIRN